MGKYTVCLTTYIVIESDDLGSAYSEGENLRGGVSHILQSADNKAADEYKQDIIGVELAGVYEVEDLDNEEEALLQLDVDPFDQSD